MGRFEIERIVVGSAKRSEANRASNPKVESRISYVPRMRQPAEKRHGDKCYPSSRHRGGSQKLPPTTDKLGAQAEMSVLASSKSLMLRG
jgi:hypothetical protein